MRKQPLRFALVTAVILTLFAAAIFATQPGRSLFAKLKIFSEIIELIDKYYVEETDAVDLVDEAIRGMVSDLDPHTSYLDTDYFKRWSQNFEGYSGIGITFDVIRDRIIVLSVFKDGPSDQAGLLPGDRIVSIEGESAIGIKRDEVPLKLMGRTGTKVSVAVQRNGWTTPRSFTLIREKVHVESIPYAFMIQPGVGYVNIERFSLTTGEELEKHLKDLELKGMKKLILDLRNNGGGHLEAAVDVVDMFLPGGKLIVYTKGRVKGSFQERFATRQATHPLVPMMILIDRASASSSEIVAGALQDWDRALILGETSFGKGLVQSQYPLSDGSALLLTTARFYTPSDRLIQRDYDDKSFNEYRAEGMVDSLRVRNEHDPNRPVHRTKILQRKVFGGGGITPDIFLKSEYDTLSTVMRKLVFDRNRYFFTFVADRMKADITMDQELNDFIKNYQPGAKTLKKFYEYLLENEFEITNQEFVDNQRDIRFFIKRSMAVKLWGEEAQFKVYVTRDRQLLESFAYLEESSALLSRAYHPAPNR